MAHQPADRGDLAQRAVDEDVGGRADAAGARVERAVLRVAEDRDRAPVVRGRRAAARGAREPGDAQDGDVVRAVDDERVARRDRRRVMSVSRPATTCAAVTTRCGARDPAGALDAEAARGRR